MKIKKDPVWNVYACGLHGIIKDNIFNHDRFKLECDEAWDYYRHDYDGFCEAIRSSLFRYYCSKYEWEIKLTDLRNTNDSFEDKKIDVYDQVMLNWDVFIKYVWDCYSGVYE